MARKRRPFEVFSMSFLDCMSCGFGAVILFFMIINAQVRVDAPQDTSIMSETTRLEREILEGPRLTRGLYIEDLPGHRHLERMPGDRAVQPEPRICLHDGQLRRLILFLVTTSGGAGRNHDCGEDQPRRSRCHGATHINSTSRIPFEGTGLPERFAENTDQSESGTPAIWSEAVSSQFTIFEIV